ncbi:MAG: hypothetical protein ACHQAX_06360 [Gammaproteobacteria bacterium]
MSLRQRIETLASNSALGMPMAILLALLPLPHWPGIVLATVVLLRCGGLLSYIGYIVVMMAAYASEQHYSIAGMSQTIGPFLTLFGPVGVMAFVLRFTRNLTLALEAGALSLVGVIGLGYLVSGPPSLSATMAFFEHRRELLGGYTEVDALAKMSELTLEQATMYLMLVWPILYFGFQSMLLLLSRFLQSVLFYRGGFKKDFHGLRLDKFSAVVFGVLFVLGNFLPQGKEMLPEGSEYVIIFQLGAVALGLLVVAGLGIAHWYMDFKRMGSWVVALLYAAIMVVGPVVLPGLAILALADTGLDLRHRLHKRV